MPDPLITPSTTPNLDVGDLSRGGKRKDHDTFRREDKLPDDSRPADGSDQIPDVDPEEPVEPTIHR